MQINKIKRASVPVIGALLIVLGVTLFLGGLYVGLVNCLIGGGVDIINAIKSSEPIAASTIAWAIIKAIFFEMPIVAGTYAGIFVGAIGFAFIFES